MTRDIGTMDTPPQGVPIPPVDDRITPVEIPADELRRTTPRVPTVAEDIFILGKWFGKQCIWSQSPQYFELNNRFIKPYREVTTERTHLHEFHSIVGRLGACLDGLARAYFFSLDLDKWHDVLLKSFFLDMLKPSNQTAGETLARIWSLDTGKFLRASSQLRTVSTHPMADDHTRAATLRVFGPTAPFFAGCNNADQETYLLDTLDHLEFFTTHKSPLVASAAMLSFRTLSRIVR